MRYPVVARYFALALLVVSCSRSAPPPPPAPSLPPPVTAAPPSASSASGASTAASAELAGLDAAELDRPTVERLRAAARCSALVECARRGVASSGCDEARRCEALRAWQSGAADTATLVALLEHPDARVRDLASRRTSAEDLDALQTKRVIATIGRERTEGLMAAMGELAAEISHAHPGVAPEVLETVRKHPSSALRDAFAYELTTRPCCGAIRVESPKLALGDGCIGGLIRDADAALRAGASRAIQTCVDFSRPTTLSRPLCADLVTLLDVKGDPALASNVASRIVEGCASLRGSMLTRAASPSTDVDPWRGSALTPFCAIPFWSTAGERQRAVTIAAAIARSHSVPIDARADVLNAVMVCMVNAGSDHFSYVRLYEQLLKDVDPAVWVKYNEADHGVSSGRP